jgi:hypothetical protein
VRDGRALPAGARRPLHSSATALCPAAVCHDQPLLHQRVRGAAVVLRPVVPSRIQDDVAPPKGRRCTRCDRASRCSPGGPRPTRLRANRSNSAHVPLRVLAGRPDLRGFPLPSARGHLNKCSEIQPSFPLRCIAPSSGNNRCRPIRQVAAFRSHRPRTEQPEQARHIERPEDGRAQVS